MKTLFLCIAAINGFIAVSLGAFGAHALKGHLSERLFSVYQTAVQYHFYHTLALLAVALLLRCGQVSRPLMISGWLFIVGIVLFSGSLYGLAFGGGSWLGPVTPLGGVSFLLGWIMLLIGALNVRDV